MRARRQVGVLQETAKSSRRSKEFPSVAVCAAHLPLSRRQAEVCFLLANGASKEKVAVRLGISRHTASQHDRWIYDKLDVHSRTGLVARLLAWPTAH